MKITYTWTIILLVASSKLLNATALTRDLQDAPSLQETLDQIDACPVCRSADDIQETSRSWIGPSLVLWWFTRRQDEAWFIDILKDKEIEGFDSLQWTMASGQLKTTAQSLRQDFTIVDVSSEVEQYGYLVADFMASSLEAVSTMIDRAQGRLTDSNDFALISLFLFYVIGFAYVICQAIADTVLCGISSLDPARGVSGNALDMYLNDLLAFCAEKDDSCVQLQDMAETLTLDLIVKRNAVFLATEEIRPYLPTKVATTLIQRIRDVLIVILLFPVVSLALVVLYLAQTIISLISNPQSLAGVLLFFVLEAFILSLFLLLFPCSYLLAIVRTAMQGLQESCVYSSVVKSEETLSIKIADTLALMQRNPFAFSMEDVECQMQSISCQSEAWAQMLPT